ncbi:excinuclease ABC subunit UvrA [Gordonia sp. HY442]|uniref:excinuclease ABC subunit UvrA n=1 Tax=Gordonia zhenghanii TaxID=2911516 RepID=UPI001F3C7F18|nr:excinuclease ABC subunit UvrA [Gordonia zhenghanii]MCF8606509.1 excinuclease ABC subunit UvrA [Gordonia zhenghanii]
MGTTETTSSTRRQPTVIEIRGARVHNLRDVDVDIPLGRLVGIAGLSGSGKSSLAMGVLYAEGSRRYLEALSTYTRRRIGQAPRADVDAVSHVPAALALRQRPALPGPRSTFGTSTELLNVLRLIFSRLASHVCPNGHRQEPTLSAAAEVPIVCPTCGASFLAPGAEELAFNSGGACATCEGLGSVRLVDDATLIPDPTKSIDDGAVIPWQVYGFRVQPQIVREMGVRTDVPWRDLTADEKGTVLDGPEVKKHIAVTSKKGVHDLDFTFRNARLTVTEELKRADTEKRLSRVSRFLSEHTCPDCSGTRLSPAARAPQIDGQNLADVTGLALHDVVDWARSLGTMIPGDLRPMTEVLVSTLLGMARRLVDLGLDYLTLDRAGDSLSTGERQRVQLARAVRNETTGVLYVLDEPSIGLHPANLVGLHGVLHDLVEGGNTVVMVDHDPQVLRAVDHLIEIGPGAGSDGGRVIAQGNVDQVAADPNSRIGGFLTGTETVVVRDKCTPATAFDLGAITIETTPMHTVHSLDVAMPRGRLTAVTGVSGSGKTTLVLESLVPALRERIPAHVSRIDGAGIERVDVVDATPIGINVRSTVGTYSGALDDLRRAYARLDSARTAGLTASDFSYNTGSLRCPRCEGTGQISLDVQFLPDVDIDCTECRGRRYAPQAWTHLRASATKEREVALPDLLAMSIDDAYVHVTDLPSVRTKLTALRDVGLGYLTLGEATPALSGGEAQRLKLVSDLGRRQDATVFVFDEPTVGLHPLDVRTLLGVLQRLVDQGGTVIVIEHDLDLIANADYVIDMGPAGGADGGRVVATGTPEEVAANPKSVTGRFLAEIV